ncbi:hypothetical protein CTI12_AA365650 [Artemisia annua]|uniref:Uncharacterized protein n=1 Tax=Artemisia annua TaxID=35608 RepID=A0A2U1MM07_ARTAN|nr:hypothetical protein CTI12_AA365650 [Artemisia annua]
MVWCTGIRQQIPKQALGNHRCQIQFMTENYSCLNVATPGNEPGSVSSKNKAINSAGVGLNVGRNSPNVALTHRTDNLKPQMKQIDKNGYLCFELHEQSSSYINSICSADEDFRIRVLERYDEVDLFQPVMARLRGLGLETFHQILKSRDGINLCVHPTDLCFKLLDNVSLEEGSMCEPVHTCRRANIDPETNVLVIGARPIGLVSMLATRALEISRIVVVDVEDSRLSVAKKLWRI